MLQKETSILQEAVKLNERFLSTSSDARPTVVCFFIQRRRSVLLVSPKGGESNWILPQGGVQRGETLAEAVRREGQEELGLLPKNFTEMISLGTCIHEVPQRENKKAHYKRLYFIGCPIVEFRRPTLNVENKGWSFVWSLGELFARAQPQDANRSMKFRGMVEAAHKLLGSGQLDWEKEHSFSYNAPEQAYA